VRSERGEEVRGSEEGVARGVAVEAEEEDAVRAEEGLAASLERGRGVAGTTVCIEAVEERDEEDEDDGVGEYGLGVNRDGDGGTRGAGGSRAAIACA
jgi:hypothetical protein